MAGDGMEHQHPDLVAGELQLAEGPCEASQCRSGAVNQYEAKAEGVVLAQSLKTRFGCKF